MNPPVEVNTLKKGFSAHFPTVVLKKVMKLKEFSAKPIFILTCSYSHNDSSIVFRIGFQS